MTTTYPATSADGRHASAMALRFRRRPGCPQAWRRLQGSMEGLVRREAKRQYRADPGYEFEDLLHAGYDAVRGAALAFDRRRGASFTTYAPYWIRRDISRRRMLMSEACHVPAHIRGAVRAWRRAGRPDDPGLAVAARLMDRPPSLSAHDQHGAMWRSWADPTYDSPGPLPLAMAADDAAWLRSALGRVAEYDPRAADVVRRKHGVGVPAETYVELAASLGVSRMRIYQIETRAVREIAEMAKDRGLLGCA